MATYLEMAGVSKWYGQVIGLNDVTVSVPEGVTGLLGPNGAGKSTFLKLATGLLQPAQGSVRLLGQNPWNNPGLMKRVGLAPEHDSFYEALTGRQFVTKLLRMSGYPAADATRRTNAVARIVSMTDALDRRIRTYSKGMRQRIKIAQALAHEPEVLFLDEPLTGTDPLGRRDLIELIRRLGDQGLNVLVSSHVLHEVEAMTTNILLVAKGRIVAEGDMHQIRALMDEHPHNVSILTPKPRPLASVLAAFEDVVTVHVKDDDALLVETRNADRFYQRLPRLLAKHGIPIRGLWSPDDNLEAIFRYLVK